MVLRFMVFGDVYIGMDGIIQIGETCVTCERNTQRICVLRVYSFFELISWYIG